MAIKFSRRKITLFISVNVGLAYAVYYVTNSILMSALSIFLFLLLWVFQVNIRAHFRNKEIGNCLNRYGDNIDVKEHDNYSGGYLFYGDKTDSCSVKADKRGVYIYYLGVGAVVIPWKNIDRVKKINKNGKNMARLFLRNGMTEDNQLVVPWLPELQDQY